MAIILWPRLDRIAVDRIIEVQEGRTPCVLMDALPPFPEEVYYASVAGSPVDRLTIGKLRQDILTVARQCGMPTDGDSLPANKSAFDCEVTTLLADLDALDSGEALRDDVWACISSAILPDVTLWRFGTSRARWQGGVRNTFQRLWMRSRTLDLGADHQDRWMLVRELSEDALVQIEERPGLGSQPRIAKAIAQGWIRAAGVAGRGRMESIMRQAVVGIRLQNAVCMLSVLKDGSLTKLIDVEFARAMNTFDSNVDIELDPGE